MPRTRSVLRTLASALLSLGLALPVLAAGGGGGGALGGGDSTKQRALASYKRGETYRNRGIEKLREAAATPDPAGTEAALADAEKQFKRALREFRKATRADRRFHQAYNAIGFSQRMLGNFEEALEAYDKALELEPGFPHAIEYRGEAYMRLGRLEDAKAAYMELFADHRKLADLLMRKMQAFIAQQREKPGEIPADRLDAFAKWLEERSEIAAQTAALTVGAEPRSW